MSDSPISIRRLGMAAAGAAALAALAGCATTPPPPPPPPPPRPQVVEAVPYRPLPPPQAAYAMTIPRRDAAGVRVTVNSELAADQAVWNFRSGWNVAALNCTRPQDAPILEGYRTMLQRHDRQLGAANVALDRQYRQLHPTDRAAIRAREADATAVYNYFTSPPARGGLCDTALGLANELLAAPPADFNAFAVNGLARFEAAFERFYIAYEAYERASADWDARFGALYGASQPGWVAVHGGGAANVGAGENGQPVVQPVPAGAR